MVHLGLGAFHRAHQAAYTALSDPEGEWRIAAFTGRSSELPRDLTAQGCRYTLIERSAQADSATIITSLAEARPGDDVERLVQLLASPSTAIVTMTLTETGYRSRRTVAGTDVGARTRTDSDSTTGPDISTDIDVTTDAGIETDTGDRLVLHDLAVLSGSLGDAVPMTALGRLLLGLDARRLSGAGPIAIVPCDNIPNNGRFAEAALLSLADRCMPVTATWIRDSVSFVSSAVDRITPRLRPEDRADAEALTGWPDRVPVVTEPYSEWILAGDFPAGRPLWEAAGARFVHDIEPFERRKLWLLNGAHTLLACAGWLRGHATIAEASTDPECRAWVDELWSEAIGHLPPDTDPGGYCEALTSRFANARMRHELDQIANEGVTKLRHRTVPVILRERALGRPATGAVRAVSSWLACVQAGRRIQDAEQAAIDRARSDDSGGALAPLVSVVDTRLAADEEVLDTIAAQLSTMQMRSYQ